MVSSLFTHLKKVFQVPAKNHYCTKYLWDYEYGNPEKEFLQALHEFRERQEKITPTKRNTITI